MSADSVLVELHGNRCSRCGLPCQRHPRHQRANHEGLAIEANCFARMIGTHDIEEGISAWQARREPHFDGT